MFGSLLYGVLRWPSRVRQDTGGQSRVSSHLTPADSTHSCELKQRTSPSHLRSCRVVRRRGSYLLCATRISSQSFTDRATPADTYSVRRRRRPDPSRCSRRTDTHHTSDSADTRHDTQTRTPTPHPHCQIAFSKWQTQPLPLLAPRPLVPTHARATCRCSADTNVEDDF